MRIEIVIMIAGICAALGFLMIIGLIFEQSLREELGICSEEEIQCLKLVGYGGGFLSPGGVAEKQVDCNTNYDIKKNVCLEYVWRKE